MAFEQELLSLLPRLRRFARGLTQNVADADDLCQAAIERALTRNRSDCALYGSGFTWTASTTQFLSALVPTNLRQAA